MQQTAYQKSVSSILIVLISIELNPQLQVYPFPMAENFISAYFLFYYLLLYVK